MRRSNINYRDQDADGSIQHWHITSGKCLHTISNEKNQLYALDYRLDGTQFAVAGRDYAVRDLHKGILDSHQLSGARIRREN